MSARNGMRPAVVGTAITEGTNRRVILYGDSLAFEARDAFAFALQRGDDIEVVDRTFGGTAICDRLGRMRQDLHDLPPAAVVFEFAGNNVTSCMQGPPCLPSEGAQQGCGDGRIRVRALDGVHFCPVREGPGTDRCPVYSSGAVRFGLAMAGPVRRDLLGALREPIPAGSTFSG